MLSCAAAPFQIAVITTPFRLDLLASTETVPRAQQTGLFVDLTGGIVEEGGVKVWRACISARCPLLTQPAQYSHINIVKPLPEAAGGGRIVVATAVTETKRSMAFKVLYDVLANYVLFSKGASSSPSVASLAQR